MLALLGLYAPPAVCVIFAGLFSLGLDGVAFVVAGLLIFAAACCWHIVEERHRYGGR